MAHSPVFNAGCLAIGVLGGSALMCATACAQDSTPARPGLHRSSVAAPGSASVALDRVSPGDTIVLAAGTHHGPLRVARPVVLRGEPGAVVDGGKRGSVIVVAASGAVIEDLELRGSGSDVTKVDAAIQVLDVGGV